MEELDVILKKALYLEKQYPYNYAVGLGFHSKDQGLF